MDRKANKPGVRYPKARQILPQGSDGVPDARGCGRAVAAMQDEPYSIVGSRPPPGRRRSMSLSKPIATGDSSKGSRQLARGFAFGRFQRLPCPCGQGDTPGRYRPGSGDPR